MARVDATDATPPAFGKILARATTLACIGALLGVIAVQGTILVREFLHLRSEEAFVRRNAIIGYPNINPVPSYAAVPADWFHDEGVDTLLWAGWKKGRNTWFRVARGDIRRDQVSAPFGCDVVQAIDYPIAEEGSGEYWSKIPDEAHVAALEFRGAHAAYPLRVLEKVEVINDHMAEIPLVVVFTPFTEPTKSVGVYEAVLDGRRLTLGSSGYFFGKRPLLYDRTSRSLWTATEGEIVAVAGPQKGATLRRLHTPTISGWADWRARHPQGRLIVGADRSRGKSDS